MSWTAPKTWVHGEELEAVEFNEQIRDNFLAIGGAWEPYTVAWTGLTTNPTIGNGTLQGRVRRAGALVHYTIEIVIGSTTSMGSGEYRLSLPTPLAEPSSWWPIGQAMFRNEAAPATRARTVISAETGLCAVVAEDGTRWASGGIPIAMPAGTTLRLNGSYQGS